MDDGGRDPQREGSFSGVAIVGGLSGRRGGELWPKRGEFLGKARGAEVVRRRVVRAKKRCA